MMLGLKVIDGEYHSSPPTHNPLFNYTGTTNTNGIVASPSRYHLVHGHTEITLIPRLFRGLTSDNLIKPSPRDLPILLVRKIVDSRQRERDRTRHHDEQRAVEDYEEGDPGAVLLRALRGRPLHAIEDRELAPGPRDYDEQRHEPEQEHRKLRRDYEEPAAMSIGGSEGASGVGFEASGGCRIVRSARGNKTLKSRWGYLRSLKNGHRF
ncbi:hypothetical protein TruAng_003444 [Truncatella angustata]|nr:hypothetical protein TruAng_003444 [Truncatella angustata]